MATTPAKTKATPVKEAAAHPQESVVTKKEFEVKPDTQTELLNKDFNPTLINEEERVRLINKYPVLVQNDFDQKDGESIKMVFARVAAKIGLTGQQLQDYLRDK